MKRILKYRLSENELQEFLIQSNEILSIKEQNNKMVMYALTDTALKIINYQILVVATGVPISFPIEEFIFLDTVKLHGGSIMFHVFYRKI